MDLKTAIRTIPDFPKPGIKFRDVTTLLTDAAAYGFAIDSLAEIARRSSFDKVAGIDARGFIVGGALSHELALGFVPVRKKGKLPGKTLGQAYDLEYGSDAVEIHVDAIAPGEKVLVVDDLLATGGTAEATIKLVTAAGGIVTGCCFVVELPDLGGRARLERMGSQVFSLVQYAGH